MLNDLNRLNLVCTIFDLNIDGKQFVSRRVEKTEGHELICILEIKSKGKHRLTSDPVVFERLLFASCFSAIFPH